MDNVRKCVDVKLLTKWDGKYGIEAQISSPLFDNSLVFSENLVAIQLKKVEVQLDKPIYANFEKTSITVSRYL